MKKNISRIQRWLDRLSSACESEKWDSALIEADCLSAEVRRTRERLCSVVCVGEKTGRLNPHGLFVILRTAGVALVIVLAASLPSAVEADKPWAVTNTKTVYVKEDRLSWVTPEEEELLLTLRSELLKSDLAVAARAPAPKQSVSKSARWKKKLTVDAPDGKKQVEPVTNEDLMALIQIGEKALLGNSPAIEIIN